MIDDYTENDGFRKAFVLYSQEILHYAAGIMQKERLKMADIKKDKIYIETFFVSLFTIYY